MNAGYIANSIGLNWLSPLPKAPTNNHTNSLMLLLHKLKIKTAVAPYPVGTCYIDTNSFNMHVTIDGFNWVKFATPNT